MVQVVDDVQQHAMHTYYRMIDSLQQQAMRTQWSVKLSSNVGSSSLAHNDALSSEKSCSMCFPL